MFHSENAFDASCISLSDIYGHDILLLNNIFFAFPNMLPFKLLNRGGGRGLRASLSFVIMSIATADYSMPLTYDSEPNLYTVIIAFYFMLLLNK